MYYAGIGVQVNLVIAVGDYGRNNDTDGYDDKKGKGISS